jgi:hypothetical protein
MGHAIPKHRLADKIKPFADKTQTAVSNLVAVKRLKYDLARETQSSANSVRRPLWVMQSALKLTISGLGKQFSDLFPPAVAKSQAIGREKPIKLPDILQLIILERLIGD